VNHIELSLHILKGGGLVMVLASYLSRQSARLSMEAHAAYPVSWLKVQKEGQQAIFTAALQSGSCVKR
jgi:hypothetical protein